MKDGSDQRGEGPRSPGNRAPRTDGAGAPSRARGRAGSGSRTGVQGKHAGSSGRTRRPGRPRGSVSLTAGLQETIVSYIAAGGLPHVAARAAGVNARTFRDWMARGEGRHPTREPTPKLRRFAKAVNQAMAQTRLLAESRMFKEHPALWLKSAARTTGDLQGWSDPEKDRAAGSAEPLPSLRGMSDEELDLAVRQFAVEEADAGRFESPPCPDPRCPCEFHKLWNAPREPGSDELDRARRPAHIEEGGGR